MISDRAHVDPSAKIGKDVTIHAFAYIDKDVEIGDGCEIMPYASILRGTRLGANNKVYQGAVVRRTSAGRAPRPTASQATRSPSANT